MLLFIIGFCEHLFNLKFSIVMPKMSKDINDFWLCAVWTDKCATCRINVLCVVQSVANNFSDEQIKIWILFAKDIFYKYEYEYYSWHFVSQIWMRISFVTNIHEYIQIYKYIWIFEEKKSNPRLLHPTSLKIVIRYQIIFVTFHTVN